jgi:hypothetical protein
MQSDMRKIHEFDAEQVNLFRFFTVKPRKEGCRSERKVEK